MFFSWGLSRQMQTSLRVLAMQPLPCYHSPAEGLRRYEQTAGTPHDAGGIRRTEHRGER